MIDFHWWWRQRQLRQKQSRHHHHQQGFMIFSLRRDAFTGIFICSLIHSFIYTFIHSSNHSFIHSFIHPFIHPFIHIDRDAHTCSHTLSTVNPREIGVLSRLMWTNHCDPTRKVPSDGKKFNRVCETLLDSRFFFNPLAGFARFEGRAWQHTSNGDAEPLHHCSICIGCKSWVHFRSTNVFF